MESLLKTAGNGNRSRYNVGNSGPSLSDMLYEPMQTNVSGLTAEAARGSDFLDDLRY
jgi:hypothetical protein